MNLKKKTASQSNQQPEEGLVIMKTATRLIALAVLLSGTFFVSSTLACTTSAWSGTTGSPVADSPKTVSRVSGLCGMELIEAGNVMDTSPAAETTVIARFYVYAQLISGAPVIFEAFSDNAATTSLLTVTFDGTNFVFDAGAGASGNVAGKSGWNLVEIAWTGGTGMDYWVNADASSDAATGNVGAAAGAMESVILGADALDGILTFDDYESHRSLAVGALLVGDSNNDGQVNGLDISGILKESNAFTPVLQFGTPDCNLDGSVSGLDISGILKAADAFSPVPCG